MALNRQTGMMDTMMLWNGLERAGLELRACGAPSPRAHQIWHGWSKTTMEWNEIVPKGGGFDQGQGKARQSKRNSGEASLNRTS